MKAEINYIIGSGGHSRSIQSLIANSNSSIITIGPSGSISEEAFLSQKLVDGGLFNGIGFFENNLTTRIKVFQKFKLAGFKFNNIIGSSSVIKSTLINTGIQIFEQAYVGPNVSIGDNVVINTAAVVEHDCVIEDSCFISPGALVLGAARIGKGTFIGAGAIIFPGTSISNGIRIPAGSVVSKDY